MENKANGLVKMVALTCITLAGLVFGGGCEGIRTTTYEEKNDSVIGDYERNIGTGNYGGEVIVPQLIKKI